MEMGKRISNNVVHTGNVLCRDGEMVPGSNKENVAEGHEAWAV